MTETVAFIRATHPYAFRAGEWARLLTTITAHGRDCYLVEFPDGVTDFWVIENESAGYEFRGAEEQSGHTGGT